MIAYDRVQEVMYPVQHGHLPQSCAITQHIFNLDTGTIVIAHVHETKSFREGTGCKGPPKERKYRTHKTERRTKINLRMKVMKLYSICVFNFVGWRAENFRSDWGLQLLLK